MPAIAGFVLVFFGGNFFTLAAAVEAYRMIGFDETKTALVALHKSYKVAMEASKKDDEVDDDGDGIADVKQISSKGARPTEDRSHRESHRPRARGGRRHRHQRRSHGRRRHVSASPRSSRLRLPILPNLFPRSDPVHPPRRRPTDHPRVSVNPDTSQPEGQVRQVRHHRRHRRRHRAQRRLHQL
jgi:hypothetical protein